MQFAGQKNAGLGQKSLSTLKPQLLIDVPLIEEEFEGEEPQNLYTNDPKNTQNAQIITTIDNDRNSAPSQDYELTESHLFEDTPNQKTDNLSDRLGTQRTAQNDFSDLDEQMQLSPDNSRTYNMKSGRKNDLIENARTQNLYSQNQLQHQSTERILNLTKEQSFQNKIKGQLVGSNAENLSSFGDRNSEHQQQNQPQKQYMMQLQWQEIQKQNPLLDPFTVDQSFIHPENSNLANETMKERQQQYQHQHTIQNQLVSQNATRSLDTKVSRQVAFKDSYSTPRIKHSNTFQNQAQFSDKSMEQELLLILQKKSLYDENVLENANQKLSALLLQRIVDCRVWKQKFFELEQRQYEAARYLVDKRYLNKIIKQVEDQKILIKEYRKKFKLSSSQNKYVEVCQKLREENSQLLALLNENQIKYQQLQEENESKYQDTAELKQQLQISQQKINDLEAVNVKQIQAQTRQLEDQIKQLNSKLENQNKTVQSQNLKIQELQTLVQQKEIQNQELLQENRAQLQYQAKLESSLRELEERYKDAELQRSIQLQKEKEKQENIDQFLDQKQKQREEMGYQNDNGKINFMDIVALARNAIKQEAHSAGSDDEMNLSSHTHKSNALQTSTEVKNLRDLDDILKQAHSVYKRENVSKSGQTENRSRRSSQVGSMVKSKNFTPAEYSNLMKGQK